MRNLIRHRIIYRLLLTAALLVLTACNNNVTIALPTDGPMYIVSGNAREILQSSDIRYNELRHWLVQNQAGWSQVYATNPNGGVIVT